MTRLILVRHCTTICNEGGVLSGLTDSKLSEKGKLQANKLTEFLKNEKIDKIYTTPFSRTKETVKNLAKIKNIQIEESDLLNEINFGDFEGLSFKKIEGEDILPFSIVIMPMCLSFSDLTNQLLSS